MGFKSAALAELSIFQTADSPPPKPHVELPLSRLFNPRNTKSLSMLCPSFSCPLKVKDHANNRVNLGNRKFSAQLTAQPLICAAFARSRRLRAWLDCALPWERTAVCFHLQQKSHWCIATVRECSIWSSPGLFR